MYYYPVYQCISRLRGLIRNKEPITFFVGAGISVKSPSFAPAWVELRDGLLQALIKRSQELSSEPLDVNSLFNGIRTYATKQDLWIKPEVVLEWLYSRLSDKLFNSLKVLNVGSPNINHFVLSALFSENDNIRLATTNFDLYIKKAFLRWNSGNKKLTIFGTSVAADGVSQFSEYINFGNLNKSLLKFHGTLDCPATIQATLRQVSSPVNSDLEECFKEIISDRHMIVIGYSGNDYDIFGLFQKYVNQSRSLMWLALNEGSYRGEVNDFPNTEIYIGDISAVTEKIWAIIPKSSSIRIYPNSDDKTTLSDITSSLEQWSLSLDLFEVVYSIALFAMHIGSFEVSNTLCNLITSYRNTPKEFILRALNVHGINSKRSDPELAWILYQKAVDIIESSDNEHPLIYGNILGNLGALAHELGRNQLALEYLHESNKYARAGGEIGRAHV